MGQSLSRLNSNQLIIQLAQFQPTHYLVGPIPTNSLSSRPNSILVDWGLGLILNTQIPGRPYSKDIKLLIGLILTLTLSSRPNSNLLNWVLGLILNTQMPGRHNVFLGCEGSSQHLRKSEIASQSFFFSVIATNSSACKF